jgi:hypothetical protein
VIVRRDGNIVNATTSDGFFVATVDFVEMKAWDQDHSDHHRTFYALRISKDSSSPVWYRYSDPQNTTTWSPAPDWIQEQYADWLFEKEVLDAE